MLFYKGFKKMLQEYAEAIKVSNIEDTMLRNVFLSGYRARIAQEWIYLDNPISRSTFIRDNKDFRWMRYNIGTAYESDMSFGQYARGLLLKFDAAKCIPFLRLPIKEDIEKLVKMCTGVAKRNLSSNGNWYNMRAVYRLKEEVVASFYFTGRYIENHKDLDGDFFSQVWLADEANEGKAWTAVFPMLFQGNGDDGIVLKPKYIEVDKEELHCAHYITAWLWGGDLSGDIERIDVNAIAEDETYIGLGSSSGDSFKDFRLGKEKEK